MGRYPAMPANCPQCGASLRYCTRCGAALKPGSRATVCRAGTTAGNRCRVKQYRLRLKTRRKAEQVLAALKREPNAST